jgi:CTP synthase
MRKKFIFVTGGVLSSLGKGLSGAALGALLEARGLRVTIVKMDPYINVDPGTMSPYQHGEVYVTDDGAETDLDLGHYERFTSGQFSQRNNFTTGRIYQNVIQRERAGEYLGRTVQVIPHITDEIKRLIWEAATDVDLAIVEVGGTVGDIESLPYLEAIRQMRADAGAENVLYLHLTLVPYIKTSGEMKTKPTQHSVKACLQVGIQPDILICRTDRELDKNIRQKIAHFCNVGIDSVIAAPDVDNIYRLPMVFHEEQLDIRVLEKLGIWAAEPHLEKWQDLVHRAKNPKGEVNIGVVGKYVHLGDTYKSLNEALAHGALANQMKPNLIYVDSEDLKADNVEAQLQNLDCILVPGGFGERGVEGKILAVQYARERGLPYFGICLGMQVAVIEFARNVAGLDDANSREFSSDTPHGVVDLMDGQHEVTDKGGTMRLGAYPCLLESGSLAESIYGQTEISERHRHRYEVNPAYHDKLKGAGLKLSGTSPDGKLVEMIELEDHPFFVACQFHPEFKSKPLVPHPLFTRFVKAGVLINQKKNKNRKSVSPSLSVAGKELA